MKSKNLAAHACVAALMLMSAFLFGSQTVHADFVDDFSGSATDPGWRANTNAPMPNVWGNSTGGGAVNSYMQIQVSGAEFSTLATVEGINRPVNPVNSTLGSTWTVSASIDGGTTPKSVQAAKILTADTGDCHYNFALVVSATGVYELGIWNDADEGSAMYFPISRYLGQNTLKISSDADGNVNYYLQNPIVGNQLIYTQVGAYLSDTNFSDLRTLGLGSENYGSTYNAFWQNASASTFPAPPVPNVSIASVGDTIVVSWPDTGGKFISLRQSADAFAPAESWATNNCVVSSVNGVNSVTLPLKFTAENQFFRLSRP